MGAHQVEIRAIVGIRGQHHLGGQGRGDGRGLQQGLEPVAGEQAEGVHDLHAVIEGKPLLHLQTQGRKAGPGQGLAGRQPLAPDKDLTPAEQGQADMRQRCEVAARPDRTVFRHQRGNPGIEQGEDRLDQLRPDAAVAARQGVGPQQHGGADDLLVHRLAHPDRVGDDEILLEVGEQFLLYGQIDVMAKAPVEAVGREGLFGYGRSICCLRSASIRRVAGARAT